jgi:hypothetical protein
MNADSKQADFCTYLCAILLGGLLLNAWLGWRWADPMAGLAMVPMVAKEGIAHPAPSTTRHPIIPCWSSRWTRQPPIPYSALRWAPRPVTYMVRASFIRVARREIALHDRLRHIFRPAAFAIESAGGSRRALFFRGWSAKVAPTLLLMQLRSLPADLRGSEFGVAGQ